MLVNRPEGIAERVRGPGGDLGAQLAVPVKVADRRWHEWLPRLATRRSRNDGVEGRHLRERANGNRECSQCENSRQGARAGNQTQAEPTELTS